jgi:hypothetical protein
MSDNENNVEREEDAEDLKARLEREHNELCRSFARSSPVPRCSSASCSP